ncbi:hypothetical protein [Halorubrum halodurans]|uniref:hypothetical protein n=1 Tax=Halorubrum halodurans TaxID=1383851 RepID=UPI0015C5FB0D|nr:hypothetical protein [Halorubrum halodurans]
MRRRPEIGSGGPIEGALTSPSGRPPGGFETFRGRRPASESAAGPCPGRGAGRE